MMTLAAALAAAGGAWGAVHSVRSDTEMRDVLEGPTLADGDVIEVANDYVKEDPRQYYITKRVTIRSAGNAIYTIRLADNTSGTQRAFDLRAALTLENITIVGYPYDPMTGSEIFVGISLQHPSAALTLGAGATLDNIAGDFAAIMMYDPAATVTICDGAVITNCHQTHGIGGAISLNAGTLTMTGGKIVDCVEDASQLVGFWWGAGAIWNTNTNNALIRISGGEITGCRGPTAGAIAAACPVYISGDCKIVSNRKIYANYADAGECNIYPMLDGGLENRGAQDVVRLEGELTGLVGVSYPDFAAYNARFGTYIAGAGATNFFHDVSPEYRGRISGGTLVWGST